MKIGKVGSVPVSMKAMMNSSKEIVKQSSRLATTPGKTMGRVIRQKVHQALAPKSADASSMALSKPSKRGMRVAMAKGVTISTWPMVTV